MDRTDTLGETPDLDPRHRRPRHGHAPALWLALPLAAGSLAASAGLAPALPCLALGAAAALAGRWAAGRARAASLLLAIAGLALGAAWHGARAAPRAPWAGPRAHGDVFLEVERVEVRGDGRWWALGTVERGPAGAARRRMIAEGKGVAPARGSLSVVRGSVRPADLEGPGAGWRRSLGITLAMGGAVVGGEVEPASAWTRWTDRAAARLESALQESWREAGRGERLLAATMLGRTRLLPEEDKAAFAATGTLHLFAISGLHIAGMAAMLVRLGDLFRLDRRRAAAVALVALAVYVEVTGGAPSARRAWLMAAGILACRLLERRANPVQGLAAAGALTLVLDPEAAADAGFQLSYLSVAGILLAGSPAAREAARPSLAERLTPEGARPASNRARAWLAARAREGLCVSAGASLAGLGTVVSLFGQLSVGGVLVNVAMVPLSAVPLALGMGSVALAPLAWADPLRMGLNTLASAWLEGMAELAGVAAAIPGMSWELEWRHPVIGDAATLAMAGMLLANAEAEGWRRLLLRPLALAIACLLALARTGT
ncbi:MAG: ComEC/Rec2 family competence protein [Opitutia bacterium]